MKYGTTSVIIEIEKKKSRKVNFQRYTKALLDLKRSNIKGHRVIAIWAKDIEGFEIPHFGHDFSCGNKCDKMPNDIIRYFNVELIIDNPAKDIFGTYKLNKNSQMTVCGVPVKLKLEDTKELQLI
jgi:hypothetical protein